MERGSDNVSLFQTISTFSEANDRIFGICTVRMKSIKITGINPEYSVMIIPGGTSKRYHLEENTLPALIVREPHGTNLATISGFVKLQAHLPDYLKRGMKCT